MNLKLLLTASAMTIVSSINAETITIHGSTTVEANLFTPFKSNLEAATGDTYNIVGNGSSRGIKGVDSGASQIGMISSKFESTMEKLKMTERSNEFTHEKVGESVATFAVHPSNPVTDLSKEQVADILTGKITNWSEVGGNNAPIVVITEYAGGGLRSTIEKKVLNKASIVETARALPNASLIPKVTSQLPTAFATVSKILLKDSNLKQIKTDADVIQPLILVIKGNTHEEAFNRLTKASKEALK